jgi:predicted alpha/beta-fold hydrolase
MLAPAHGGHVGFVGGDQIIGEDRFWAENRLIEFCQRMKSKNEGGKVKDE